MKFSKEAFEKPAKKHRPLIRWWWVGMAVEPEKLKQELMLMDESGFGGVEIQPFLFGGGAGHSNDKKHRMAPNPFYFDMLKVVCEEAAGRDLIVDVSAGSAWPPGGTHISKEHNLKTLLAGTEIVTGPQSIEMELPPIQLNAYYKYRKIMSSIMGGVQDDFSQYTDLFKPVATVAVRPKRPSDRFNFFWPHATPLEHSTARDITDFVDQDGILRWEVPDGKWQIFSFYGGPTGMKPMSVAKSDPEKVARVVDMLDRNAVDVFLDGLFGLTSGDFKSIRKYCGDTLRAIFTDSQEIADEWFWSEPFFESFKKLRGYDVKPFLPVCFVPNRDNQFLEVFFQNSKPCFEFKEDRIGERIRHDWLRTLSDVWIDEYIRYVSEWGEEYGIKHRIQTYGMPVDLLQTFGASDIPETETLFSGALDFFKLAGSSGIIYEKPIVSSETFSWMRKDLMTNPIKWKVACDRLFVSGINQIVYHGWAYQPNPDEYPGHYPWKGHGFSEDMGTSSSYYDHYPELNEYVTRIQYILGSGTTKVQVGIYYQHWNYTYKHISGEDNEEGTLPGYDAKRIGGPIPWFMRRVRSEIDKTDKLQQDIGHELMEYGYNYVHLNEDAMGFGELKYSDGSGGDHIFKVGNAELNAIILPSYEFISYDVAKKLHSLAENGIAIVFVGSVPWMQAGYLDYKKHDNEIRRLLDPSANENIFLIRRKDHTGSLLNEKIGVDPDVSFKKPEPFLAYIHKKIESGDVYFFRYGKPDYHSVNVSFNDDGKSCYRLDPWNGKIYRMSEALEPDGDILLDFAPYGSIAVLFTDNEVADMLPNIGARNDMGCYIHPVQVENVAALKKWNLTVKHRTAQGDRRDISLRDFVLVDWRRVKELRYCSGPGMYKTRFIWGGTGKPESMNVEVYLCLGRVQDIANVRVNGVDLGHKIVPPYDFDITEVLQPGENTIEVEVTGTLQNRLIGYGKEHGSPWNAYAKRTLMPVGLLGPVSVELRTYKGQYLVKENQESRMMRK